MRFVCPNPREKFEELKKQFTPSELYLSYKTPSLDKAEKLVDHLYQTAETITRLDDHIHIASRLLRRLEKAVSGRDFDIERAKRIANKILVFVAFYHDIGKAEVQYQLYARHEFEELCRECTRTPPHNYSSVAFLTKVDDIREKFIGTLHEEGLSLKVADLTYVACLTAIAMHHEYFDYKDIAFLDFLTPLTLSLAKELSPDTMLVFDDTYIVVLDEAVKRLRADVPLPRSRGSVTATLSEVLEHIAVIHYEFGATLVNPESLSLEHRSDYVRATSSLAEALTWILTIADNLAARTRGSSDPERSFFASLIERYYG